MYERVYKLGVNKELK